MCSQIHVIGTPSKDTPELHIATNIFIGILQRNADLLIVFPSPSPDQHGETACIHDEIPYGMAINKIRVAIQHGLVMAALQHRPDDDMFQGWRVSTSGKFTPISTWRKGEPALKGSRADHAQTFWPCPQNNRLPISSGLCLQRHKQAKDNEKKKRNFRMFCLSCEHGPDSY